MWHSWHHPKRSHPTAVTLESLDMSRVKSESPTSDKPTGSSLIDKDHTQFRVTCDPHFLAAPHWPSVFDGDSMNIYVDASRRARLPSSSFQIFLTREVYKYERRTTPVTARMEYPPEPVESASISRTPPAPQNSGSRRATGCCPTQHSKPQRPRDRRLGALPAFTFSAVASW